MTSLFSEYGTAVPAHSIACPFNVTVGAAAADTSVTAPDNNASASSAQKNFFVFIFNFPSSFVFIIKNNRMAELFKIVPAARPSRFMADIYKSIIGIVHSGA